MRTIKILLAAGFLLVFGTSIHAQVQRNETYLPKFAIKTNALYWATSTPNLGFEIGLAKKLTLDVSGNYNPWKFSDNKQFKHWLVQPELRYWTCDVFNGWFFGLHAHGGQMNIGGIDVPFVLQKGDGKMKEHRYEGYFWGGGLSAGYQWVVSNRFNIEASLGIGYVHTRYDKYKCTTCGKKEGKGDADYIGPTRAAISIIYMLK